MSLLRPFALSILGLSAGLSQNETPPGDVIPAPANPTPAIPVTPANPGNPTNPNNANGFRNRGAANPNAPVDPANPVVAQAGAVPLGQQKITEPIVEPKLSGTALAGLYRKYTGRRVIVSQAAAIAEFSFVQDASPSDPLSYAEAAELLKKAATIENFVFVPDGGDKNLDILTVASGGINPKARGIAVFTESDVLPEGDAVISYVMNLQHLKPDAVVTIFQQVIGQFGAYGSIAPVANASAVVITENTSLIRKLIDLKKEIDKPSSLVATRFIKVEYADVTELSTTLMELLSQQQSAQQTASAQRTGMPNPGGMPNGVEMPGMAGAGGGGQGSDTPVQIVPDPRTNRLFAMGRPVDLLFVEGLVREFDTQSDQRNFLRRKLRFLKVAEFLPIARDALTRAFSGTGDASGGAAGAGGGAPGGGAAGAAGGGAARTNNNRSTTANRNTSNTSSNNFGTNASGGGGGGSTGGSALSDPNVSTAPVSDLVGRTLLVADNITNSIVVQGPPSGVEIIEKLLDEIDVKADQVMISCVFGQLTLTDGHSFGVDYVKTLSGRNAVRGGSGQGLDDGVDLLPGGEFNPGVLGAAAGLSLYGQIGKNLNVYLRAMQSDSNFKVLSRPTIFTANNQKGSIISGTQIAVPTSSYSSGVSTTASTNFEYKDVALQLEVIPLVNSENEVTLQIYLTSDDVGPDRTVGTGDNAYTIPDILKRELITTVTVPNNQTIVLGGLITETVRDSRSGIPILHRIPLIGPLFGTKTKAEGREELLIFIQPSIVRNESTLEQAQIDMDTRYKTSGDTRRFADGPGVLPPPDNVPIVEKGSTTTTTTTTRRAILVDPKATPSTNPYPHGTRFRTGGR